MLPGARTPSFGPSLGLLRRCRSAVFHESMSSMTMRSLWPSRTRLTPPRPGQGACLSCRSSATTMPASAAAHSSAGAPVATQHPRKTPGEGIEEPPFSPPFHPSSSSSPSSSPCFSSSVLCFGRYFPSCCWWPANCELGETHNSPLLLFDFQQDPPV